MAYKHGVYGEREAYSGKSLSKAVGTVPVYIGCAPVHRVNTENRADFDYSPYILNPIIINSFTDAKNKIGVCADFDTFSLMEAVYAHFMNEESPIAPIIVINMADPNTVYAKAEEVSVILTGASGAKSGVIEDSAAKIETVTPEGLSDGEYELSYIDGGIKITVSKADFADGKINVSYGRVDTSNDTITPEIFTQAVEKTDLCEMLTGEIPNLMLAPFYSEIKEYHDLMLAKCAGRLAEKWNILALCDILADASCNTIDAAIAKKETDGYNSHLEKIFYPQVKYNSRIYHLSTMAAVRMQQTDTANDGVPYISPSNEAIYADGSVLNDGTALYISEQTANSANAEGITTVNMIRGELRLWGGACANYSYIKENSIDPEYRQDTSIRMTLYILNKLQYDYIDTIDGPMARRDVDSILSSVQMWLNSLVNEGKLLYGKVDFTESENSLSDMVSGDFVFCSKYTTAPNAKSITFKAQYSEEGLKLLWGGDSE